MFGEANLAGKVTVKISGILGVIWGGLFRYEGFAYLILPEHLYILVLVGPGLGFLLTIAVLVFALKFTKAVRSGGGMAADDASLGLNR